MVVAISKQAFRVTPDKALEHVFGYATGLDMTCRDLQTASRRSRGPGIWARMSSSPRRLPRSRAPTYSVLSVLSASSLKSHADKIKQDAKLADIVWSMPEIISQLSRFYHLGPGDLVYSGTPTGVGAVKPGDRIVGEIDGLAPARLTIGPA